MCFECIKERCLEMSDLIYELKHKLTDDEFKRILDSYKFIFDATKGIQEHYGAYPVEHEEHNSENEQEETESDPEDENESGHEEPEEEPESESEPELEDVVTIRSYNQRIYSVPYPEDECECVTTHANELVCILNRKMRECTIYKALIADIPLLEYVAQLSEGIVPIFPSTFSLQTTKPGRVDYTLEEKVRIQTTILVMLRILSSFKTYPTDHPANMYHSFVVLVIYDYTFRHISICFTSRIRHMTIERINQFTSSSLSNLHKVQEILPNINIAQTFDRWDEELEDI